MATQPTESKPRVRAGGDELTVIAQRAQAFTNASGTAIALSEGNADEIICRARSGSAAPEVGTALRVEGSFTGLCIQTGKELRCDDAETDTRVDTAAIRALGIKSMVVTPIKEDNKVIGVIACFAPTAHAFTITHVAVLKTMADQISVLLQKERRMREEGIEPAASAQPAPTPRPAPGPVIVKPAPVSSTPAASSGPAVAAAPARTPVPVVNKVELKPAPLAAEVAPQLAVPKFEEKPKTEVRASFGTFDSVAGETSKPSNNNKLIAIVAIVAVAAAITFYFAKGHKASAASVASAQPRSDAASTQPASAAGFASNTAPASTTASSSQPVSSSANTVSVSKPAPVQAEARKVEKPSARPVEKAAAAPEPQPKSEPMTVSLNGGPSRLHASAGQSNDVAPVMSVGSASASGALSSLARPVATSTPGMAQSELEPLKVLKTVPPTYPEIAKIRRLSGSVVVEVKVGKDGKVNNVRYVSGQPVFTDAASDAVRQWKFKPATLNGQPIEQSTQIKVDFHP